MKHSTFVLFMLFLSTLTAKAQNTDYFTTTIHFPADYTVGDYIEFAQANPIAANASGYYEISIAYTRGNVAAAATHIAAASHANSSFWREAGRVNNNIYTTGANKFNFTVDLNATNHRFRIRAVNTIGVNTILPVSIKIRSINIVTSFTPIATAGHTDEQIPFLPMTAD